MGASLVWKEETPNQRWEVKVDDHLICVEWREDDQEFDVIVDGRILFTTEKRTAAFTFARGWSDGYLSRKATKHP